jgi:hypothetical protein
MDKQYNDTELDELMRFSVISNSSLYAVIIFLNNIFSYFMMMYNFYDKDLHA